MKRILLLVSVLLITLTMAACGGDSREKLYVLNWGEYIDPDLVVAFEDEFNVNVVYQEVGSNEEMENKLTTKAAPYDIVIPSDYMIDKMRQQDMLQEIDYTKLTSLDQVSIKEEVTQLYAGKGYEAKDKSPHVKMALSAMTALVWYQTAGYQIINFN